MKHIVLAISLLISHAAFAGSANCTSPTAHIDESPQYYDASLSDCIISVERTSFTPVQISLPANPSLGDYFEVVDATPFEYDHCDEPFWDEEMQQWRTFCFPAAVSVVSYNDTHLISGVMEIANAGSYEQGAPARYLMKFTFNGIQWDFEMPE